MDIVADKPKRPPSAVRQALMWAIKIGVSAILLYILFSRIDTAELWAQVRGASVGWIVTALAVYSLMILVATWRWRVLLGAQHVSIPFGRLLNSYLAATFANNFLPSNIGGDVIRISDTARPAKSKTLATAIVLADRVVGVLGLAFIAALGSTMAAQRNDMLGPVFWAGLLGMVLAGGVALAKPDWIAALARPLRVFHANWVDRRIETATGALHRFRQAPGSMAIGFIASVALQALQVLFYASVAAALHLTVPLSHMAILVPFSSLVQMLPVSVNGHGVREGTFVAYLTRVGVQREGALALSLTGAALIMLFSMSGAAAYLARRHKPTAEPETA
jgi:uncharacterized membrane protein YbhN (UPF0104 family)